MCMSTGLFSTSVLVPALQFRGRGYSKFQRAKENRFQCLKPDVLFRDEFSSLHSAIVIYIGPASTNEGPPPNAKTKTEGREKLFAIWSINKNANSGKPFLSCDNGGVVNEGPKTTRRMDLQISTQNSLSLT